MSSSAGVAPAAARCRHSLSAWVQTFQLLRTSPSKPISTVRPVRVIWAQSGCWCQPVTPISETTSWWVSGGQPQQQPAQPVDRVPGAVEPELGVRDPVAAEQPGEDGVALQDALGDHRGGRVVQPPGWGGRVHVQGGRGAGQELVLDDPAGVRVDARVDRAELRRRWAAAGARRSTRRAVAGPCQGSISAPFCPTIDLNWTPARLLSAPTRSRAAASLSPDR